MRPSFCKNVPSSLEFLPSTVRTITLSLSLSLPKKPGVKDTPQWRQTEALCPENGWRVSPEDVRRLVPSQNSWLQVGIPQGYVEVMCKEYPWGLSSSFLGNSWLGRICWLRREGGLLGPGNWSLRSYFWGYAHLWLLSGCTVLKSGVFCLVF